MSRCLGLFSYYSQWIPKFSDRIKPLASFKTFPLPSTAVEAFESLAKTIEDAIVTAIDETIPFEVETDASEVALAATLNQNGNLLLFLTNPSKQRTEASLHRERSPGHNRSVELFGDTSLLVDTSSSKLIRNQCPTCLTSVTKGR